MKKCPNCQKSYDNDNLKFCQTDGTPLVAVAEEPEVDPYKTVVGNQAEISSIIAEQDKESIESDELPADPFQTLVAPPPPPKAKAEPIISDSNDEDILEVDDEDEIDPMKTMVISGNTVDNIKVSIPDEKPADEPSPKVSFDTPKFDEKQNDVVSSPTPEPTDKSQFEQTEDKNFGSNESPFEKTSSSIPIQSPFDESMPPGYAPPSTPPFEPPKEALKPEPLNDPLPEPPKSPFADPELNSADNSGDSWSKLNNQDSSIDDQSGSLNAPVTDWGSNEISSNSPSNIDSTPTTEGQNMTLSYVSLATGVLSMTLCCWIGIIMGPAGIVTGFLARKKIAENPSQYGGDKFALIGMITGVIGFIIWFGLTIFNLFFSGLNGFV